MKRIQVGLVLTLTIVGTVGALAEPVQEALGNCRPIATAPVVGEQIRFQPSFRTGVCWGAFEVIQQTIRWRQSDKQPPLMGVCAPPESSRSQLIAIFVSYADRHPKRWHEEFAFVAYDALIEAYPCP